MRGAEPRRADPGGSDGAGHPAPGGGKVFRSLRYRNFRIYLPGQLVSQSGNWITLIAQTLLVLELTDDGVALGILAAAQFGPVLVLGAFAGVVADRSDKRRLLILVHILSMAQSIVLGALAWNGSPPLWSVYLVAAAGGVLTAFDNPTRRSFVVEMVPPAEIPNAVSLNSAVMTLARVIGPALGGLLVTTVGYSWAFWIDAATYLAVLLGLTMLRTGDLRRAPVTPRGRGQVREGLSYAWRIEHVRVPLVMMAIVGTLAFEFPTVLPLFTTRDLGGSELTFSLLMTVVSVGSFAGALVAARRTTVTIRMLVLATVGFGITMVALALAPNVPAAFAIAVLMGLGSLMFMTTGTAIVQLRTSATMRGRVLALQSIVFLGSTPIGGPIVGVLAEHVGARWALALGAAACFGAAMYGLPAARRDAGQTM